VCLLGAQPFAGFGDGQYDSVILRLENLLQILVQLALVPTLELERSRKKPFFNCRDERRFGAKKSNFLVRFCAGDLNYSAVFAREI
jgi:hypothetical protein